MDFGNLIGEGGRPTALPRIGAAVVWIVMAYDLYERTAANHVAGLITSLGLLGFYTLAVLLPVTFLHSRPPKGSPSRIAFDATVVSALVFALGGLLARTFGHIA